MKINLDKAHVLTRSDNTKLYEVAEILRLESMIDDDRATHLNDALTKATVTELEYRKALQGVKDDSKPTIRERGAQKPCYNGRTAIINSSTQTAYILPLEQEFRTSSAYSTFTHDELNQLNKPHADLIRTDLRTFDILRVERFKQNGFYRVVEL